MTVSDLAMTLLDNEDKDASVYVDTPYGLKQLRFSAYSNPNLIGDTKDSKIFVIGEIDTCDFFCR